MSKIKILFAEDKKYFDDLGVTKFNLEKYEVEFDGIKKYKISDFDIKKYDYVISCLYTNPNSNFLIIKAKKNNIKTIMLADGIIDWSNSFINPLQKKYNLDLYHPIIHDLFLCVGKDESEYFEYIGGATMQYMPKRIINDTETYPLPKNKCVLITTANMAYFNDSERDRLLKLLKNVSNKLDEMNIKYKFRIFDQYLIENLKIDEANNYKVESFELVLKTVDAVITTPSSISLNSMYHNRAVGQLIYRDSPMFIQSGWMISDSCNLEETIRSMLSCESDRIMYQNYQVSKYLNDISFENIELKFNDIKSDKNIEKFINTNLYNMLNSVFNFNLEYIFRKIYIKVKKNSKINSFFKYIRNDLK